MDMLMKNSRSETGRYPPRYRKGTLRKGILQDLCQPQPHSNPGYRCNFG
jgi:hypothetical protein